MRWLRRTVIVFALVEAGWLAFDGGRALLVGDYLTPQTGPYAGQLGPWSEVVSAVGIDPRSTLMMSIHVVLGVAWLVVLWAFASGKPWSWWGMLWCAVSALWYLPFGTLLSMVQLAILTLTPLRRMARANVFAGVGRERA